MRIKLTIFLLLIATISIAQRPNGRRGGGSPATIKGKVIESDTQNPLEFASVTLKAMKDSTIIGGAMTMTDGTFQIKTRPGRFFAEVEFIGFESKTIPNIIVKPGSTQDLGTIAINSGEMLEEVNIVAEKSEMQFTLDKRVFNVGKDLSSTGGNAQDLLDNIPSVTVGVEGEVELRGSSNVRILVNGRPSGLVGIGDTEGLRNIPASMIEKVEVITNPSAKYEAEGMTGILNIILKEERKGGFNGSFEASAGYPEMYGVGANLNYRANNINWFLNYGYRNRQGGSDGNALNISYLDNAANVTRRKMIRDQNGNRHSFRFGGDYFITPKQTLTAAFVYRTGVDKNLNSVTYRDQTFTTERPSRVLSDYDNVGTETIRYDKEREADNKQEYSLRYDYKISRDNKLRVNLSYQNQDENENSNITETTGIQQKSANAEGETQWRLQADYDKKFGDFKIETGALGSIRNVRNDYEVQDLINNAWVSNADYTNIFDYDENIYAAYFSFGQEIGNFSYLGGLRYEYSDISTKLLTTNEVNDRAYGNFFPSAFLNYKLPKDNQIQLSYSRRITRPRFWDLNPFFTFVDRRNFFSGNPDVDPSYTNSFELGHLKYWENFNIGTTVYYRKATDVIRRLKTFELRDNISYSSTKPVNSGYENSYGLELISGYSGIKNMRIDASANFFGYKTVSEDESIQRSGQTFTGSLNLKYSIGKDFDLQIRNNYRAPRKTIQGRTKSILATNIAMSQDLMNDRITLTFSVRDLFNQRRRRMVIDTPELYDYSDFQWRPRTFQMTATYRVNQKKKRGGRPQGGPPPGVEM